MENNLYGSAKMYKAHKPKKLSDKKNNDEYIQKMLDSDLYFGQIKKDGHYAMFEKDMQGNCYVFSRGISTKTGLLSEKSANIPHIVEYLDSKLPNGTILLGEAYYQGKTSKDVAKIMGCSSAKAVRRQLDGEKLQYYIFDILSYDNVDYIENKCNHLKRYFMLKQVIDMYHLLDNEYIEFAKATFDNLGDFIQTNFDNGEEGSVLRRKDKLYMQGKRPVDSMIKFKTEELHDVICMGFEEPTHEYTGSELDDWKYFDTNENPITKAYYKGWIGAIRYGVYKNGVLIEIGKVSSGLTDDMLIKIKDNKSNFINQPFTIQAMSIDKEKLRHPRLMEWRKDIPFEDCTWDKIFN